MLMLVRRVAQLGHILQMAFLFLTSYYSIIRNLKQIPVCTRKGYTKVAGSEGSGKAEWTDIIGNKVIHAFLFTASRVP